jgi:U4/U6.U5 tri-snRNP-associated protein 2
MDIVGADAEEHAELREAGVTSDTEIEEEDESPALVVPHRQAAPDKGYEDLYLDTIDRKVLDFDFEKLCSVTLSNINVYACLVCGKYYQGRGPKSQAYFHALDVNHHVFINMTTRKIYVLPEGYEVTSRTLDDIKFVVDPRLPRDEVMRLDKEPKTSWDLSNRQYIPGFVGMNNIKANDYFNVIIHALAHVVPLRNFFMLEDLSSRPQLAQRFSTLVRKIWNPRAFKAHVSPHELLQEIALRSSKRFTLTDQSDPAEFLAWFLNHLHLAVGGSRTKPKSSIVQRVFQGQMKIESQEITARADAGDRLRFEDADVKTETTKFMILTLDLPPTPLFQDALERNIIPQVPLVTILGKYDGIHAQEKMKNRVRYRLLHPLPPYLLFHIKRFSKNKFVSERNPTIVTFPTRSLDMSPYVQPDNEHSQSEPIWYDLVANVTHEAVKKNDDSVEGEQDKKVWRVQLHDRSRDEWWGVQDLYVEKERGETLFTKESYVQVWEKRRVGGKGKN